MLALFLYKGTVDWERGLAAIVTAVVFEYLNYTDCFEN